MNTGPAATTASPSPFFRSEAVQAQTAQFLGTIRIGKLPGLTLVMCVALALVIALVSFAVFGQATRKARIGGVLMPLGGILNLSSPQAARVFDIKVKEGDTVQKGQLLAVLQTGGASTRGDTSTLVARSLADRRSALDSERRSTKAQAQQRQAALADRSRSLQADILQAEGELDAVQHRVRLSQKNLERDRQLAAQGFISEVQVQTRQEEVLDLQIRERNARRTIETLRRDIKATQADSDALGSQIQTQLAQLDRAVASLGQEDAENSARSDYTLTAPQHAIVSAINSHAGQWIQGGQAVLSLTPKTAGAQPLVAELYAPSRTAGFVAAGQDVWLRMQAFPYQKFGMVPGVVRTVSRVPVNPQDLPAGMGQALLTAATSNEPLYRITVALRDGAHLSAFGQEQAFKAGMMLEADVVQERRAVWEWVMEPLLSVRSWISWR